MKKIGIDLGTTNTLVYVPKKGIIINEPTVIAISSDGKEIFAVGAEAKEMLGRTPETIIANRPLKDGVIADYKATQTMLKYFVNKALGKFRFFRPEVMVAIPGGASSTERRAVEDATIQAGARAAYIIKEPMAAAIGAGLPIAEAIGNMIIDIGGGTTEIAVISLGGIVTSHSVRIGGNKFDQAIADYIRKNRGLAIGERTAEQVKIEIGTSMPLKEKLKMEVRGRDVGLGLPRNIVVDSDEIAEAILEELRGIIQAVKQVLQETPAELSADIMDRGMILTGGSALLRNIDRLLAEATGVPCYVAEEAILSVAKGTGIALENLEAYKRSILSSR